MIWLGVRYRCRRNATHDIMQILAELRQLTCQNPGLEEDAVSAGFRKVLR